MKLLAKYIIAAQYEITGQVSPMTLDKTTALLRQYAAKYSLVIQRNYIEPGPQLEDNKIQPITKSHITLLIEKCNHDRTKLIESYLGITPVSNRKHWSWHNYRIFSKLNINGLPIGISVLCNSNVIIYVTHDNNRTNYITYTAEDVQIIFRRPRENITLQFQIDRSRQLVNYKYLVGLIETEFTFKILRIGTQNNVYKVNPHIITNKIFRVLPVDTKYYDNIRDNLVYDDFTTLNQPSAINTQNIPIKSDHINTLNNIVLASERLNFSKVTLCNFTHFTNVEFNYVDELSQDLTTLQDLATVCSSATGQSSTPMQNKVSKHACYSNMIPDAITICKNLSYYYTIQKRDTGYYLYFSSVPFDKFTGSILHSINETMIEKKLLVTIKRPNSKVEFYYDPSTGYKLHRIELDNKVTSKNYVIRYDKNGCVVESIIDSSGQITTIQWQGSKPTSIRQDNFIRRSNNSLFLLDGRHARYSLF